MKVKLPSWLHNKPWRSASICGSSNMFQNTDGTVTTYNESSGTVTEFNPRTATSSTVNVYTNY